MGQPRLTKPTLFSFDKLTDLISAQPLIIFQYNGSVLHSFVQISSGLIELLKTHTLVTPNERLAREYRRGYELAQRNKDGLAWPTPRIQSLDQLLLESYATLREQDAQWPRVLTQHELIRMAHSAAPPGLARNAVANLIANWTLMQQYEIPHEAVSGTLFKTWCTDLEAQIQASMALSPYAVGARLTEAKHIPPRPLVCVALEQLTRPQARYFKWLCEQGVVNALQDDGTTRLVESSDALQSPGAWPDTQGLQVWAASSQHDELTAAALWAREIKLQQPDATIGIVVPDLTQHHAMVRRTIGTVLDPYAGSRSATFDISGGQALYAQPVWQHARRFCTALIERADHTTLTGLWPSPFFNLQALGTVQPWPRKLGRAFTLIEFLQTQKSEPGKRLTELIFELNQSRTLGSTIDLLRQALALAGWPNSASLDSTQYQAFQQINQALEDLSYAATDVAQQTDALAALTCIDHVLSERMFSEQRPAADIQVLGRLETTGLRFSHLWVTGMNAINFPAKPARHSFIKAAQAEAYGIPRATQVTETEFCAHQLDGWQRHAEQLVCSYVRLELDAEVPPSYFLNEASHALLPANPPHWQRSEIQLETFTDERAEPITEQPARTGVRLLEQQAACAFKGFAVYRLSLDEQRTPRLIVDPLGRGNAAHSVLFHLLRACADQTAVAELTADDLSLAIEQALNELGYPLPDRFRSHETARLTQLCEQWLQLELERPYFRIAAVEQTHASRFADITFRVRVDRQDVVDDGVIIIDYKTGNQTLTGMSGRPLTRPQLPVYAHIDGLDVQGVFYGLLHDKPQLRGFSAEDNVAAGASHGDWQTLKTLWHNELERIAQQFRSGFAEVNPIAPDACKHCHLQALCRIKASSSDAIEVD